MNALVSFYGDAFMWINAAYPSESLLELPAWRFLAFVESWLWTNVDESEHSSLGRDLDRQVDFTWARANVGAPIDSTVEPVRWQKNMPGESLLSAHRSKPTEG